MNPDDYPYCPRCKEGKWEMDVEAGICKDCGTDVQEDWPMHAVVVNRAKAAGALLFGATVLVGPWLAAVYVILEGLLEGAPLLGWETVEVTKAVTRPTGVINEAVPLVFIGVIVWVVVLFMMYGPRMRRL